MTVPRLSEIFDRLRASSFRDLEGCRFTATIPLNERVVNEIVAASLPPDGLVRTLSIHPQPADRLGVRVKLVRPEFLPPMMVTLAIERQPELPDVPTLVFRMTGLAGLLALAGPVLSIGSRLPPGVSLDGDLLTVDIAQLLTRYGYRDVLGILRRLRVNSEADRLLIEIDARVG